jgi:erythromycin esterase-like protein
MLLLGSARWLSRFLWLIRDESTRAMITHQQHLTGFDGVFFLAKSRLETHSERA